MRISNSGLLRAKLAMLQARYDNGACSGSIYRVIKELQREIAWIEHRKQPIDRGFIQNNWPMGLKRRPKRDPHRP
jgi:hypothetical protein